jgi:metal-responsive CopG/Arc/MetJ family transcriptional regulator
MGKGTKIYSVRLDDQVVTEINAVMDSSFLTSRQEPLTLSAFIRKAIDEKLWHSARSRRRKRKAALRKGV